MSIDFFLNFASTLIALVGDAVMEWWQVYVKYILVASGSILSKRL